MKHENMMKLAGRIAGLTAAAALSIAPAALAETTESAVVQGGMLNLRETASLTAKVLGQYPTGTLVEIREAGDDWHKVTVDGKDGYMMAKYLNTAEGNAKAKVRTNTGAGLNLREEPGMGGKIITSYKPGTEVTVLQKGGEWSRVLVGGQEGYMATRYLTMNTQKPVSAGGKVALVNNPKDTQVLNLRQQPSLDAKVLAYYRNGAKVTVLKAGSDWYTVQTADGRIGYMMAKFLKLTDEEGSIRPFEAKLINVNGGKIVNFRKAAGLDSAIIDKLPVGTAVTVTEYGTDWCKVTVNGQEGYISTWFMQW